MVIKTNSNKKLKESLREAPQEVIDELISILDKYGFVLDSRFKDNPGKTWMGRIHLQVIKPDEYVDSRYESIKDHIPRELLNDIDALADTSNCPITWNFGTDNTSRITGGLDISKQYVPDEEESAMKISESKKKLKEGVSYRFNDKVYATEDEVTDAISDYASETYDEWLDDGYGVRDGKINICGYWWYPSEAFKKLDPIAYNVGISDYESFLWDEVEEVEEESIKPIKEAPYYELSPRYDSRKSFYGKAHVDTGDNDDKNKLYSYDTLVAEIKDGKPVVYGTYSATTLRHIKDWLKQNGFKAETSRQIMQDYGVNESLKEGWRGSPDIEMGWNGEWADPDLFYKDYTFNYWDIEDALWDMFKEDMGYSDSDANNPDVEEQFGKYIRQIGPSYLDDVIAGGYFTGDSKDWHDAYKK